MIFSLICKEIRNAFIISYRIWKDRAFLKRGKKLSPFHCPCCDSLKLEQVCCSPEDWEENGIYYSSSQVCCLECKAMWFETWNSEVGYQNREFAYYQMNDFKVES